jgi:hypothetical protein
MNARFGYARCGGFAMWTRARGSGGLYSSVMRMHGVGADEQELGAGADQDWAQPSGLEGEGVPVGALQGGDLFEVDGEQQQAGSGVGSPLKAGADSSA